MLAEKAASTRDWNYNTQVEEPDDAENQVLEHYRSYTRKSPKRRQDKFAIETENYGSFVHEENWHFKPHKLIPLPSFLPSSVILFITMHGRTKEPFVTPVNVVRHIASDFGTCSFVVLKDIHIEPLDLIKPGFKTSEKRTGEFLKAGILSAFEQNRAYVESDRKDRSSEDTKLFLKSKHHVRPKSFKKNMPMFDKEYSYEDENPGTIMNNIGIWVRADLPLDSLVKDVLFEIKPLHSSTTLRHILHFLAERGVRDVTLFDMSCQLDRRSPIHRTRYGGK